MIADFKESPIVRQWQTTLFILNTGGLLITFACRMLFSGNTDNPQGVPALMTMVLATGIILVGVIRDYMKKYVDTSKI